MRKEKLELTIRAKIVVIDFIRSLSLLAQQRVLYCSFKTCRVADR
jgi:hypothetical protein